MKTEKILKKQDKNDCLKIEETSIVLDDTRFQTIKLDDKEKDNVQNYFSTLLEGALWTKVVSSYNGLLKCNLPADCLYNAYDKVGNIVGKRGYGSEGHGVFNPASSASLTPIVCFQVLSKITGQYYQHIISEKLDSIKKELEYIIEHQKNIEIGQLQQAYSSLVELSKKNVYHTEDFVQINDVKKTIGQLQKTYRREIDTLNLEQYFESPKKARIWTDYQYCTQKVEIINESKVFSIFEMALYSEILFRISNMVYFKMHMSDERRKQNAYNIYEELISDFGEFYISKFDEIKKTTMNYLNNTKNDAWVFKNKIGRVIDKMDKEFRCVEDLYDTNIKKLTFNSANVLYIEMSNSTPKNFYIEK